MWLQEVGKSVTAFPSLLLASFSLLLFFSLLRSSISCADIIIRARLDTMRKRRRYAHAISLSAFRNKLAIMIFFAVFFLKRINFIQCKLPAGSGKLETFRASLLLQR